jgi:pentatricopeptide repeat protein
MKSKNMPVTVVSYGSAISACEKGLQYRQCLEYLDEMTEMGIRKNVIIFGAAMSCMEKSCRADIGFQLMDRMKIEDVAANVHIYNSAISACARCNLWNKGFELFKEMDEVRVARDVVTYNAVLDAVCSQVELGRKLFKEGVEKGFYARVSRLGTQWLELDLHFLSLGGGEIALGWWFEECLVPYLINTSKLEAVQSISIVTGYGKTRSRGARMNDDGMRLRVRAMLKYMDIHETPQPNKGRIHIDKSALIKVVKKNNGRIRFDLEGYTRFKEEETTANKFPDVVQTVRPRFRPARPGQGPPGTFIRDGDPVPPHNPPDDKRRDSTMEPSMRRNDYNESSGHQENRRFSSYNRHSRDDRMPERASNSGRPSGEDRMHDRDRPMNSYGGRTSESCNQDQRHGDDWRGGPRDNQRRSGYIDHDYRGDRPDNRPDNLNSGDYNKNDRRVNQREYTDRRSAIGNDSDRRGERQPEFDERRGNNRNWDERNSFRSNRDYDGSMRGEGGADHRRVDDRDVMSSMTRPADRPSSSYHSDDRRGSMIDNRNSGRIPTRGPDNRDMRFSDRNHDNRDMRFSDRNQDRDSRVTPNSRQSETSEYKGGGGRPGPNNMQKDFRAIRDDPEVQSSYKEEAESPGSASKKRPYDDYQKQQPSSQQPPSRGYDIEPAYAKRRTSM